MGSLCHLSIIKLQINVVVDGCRRGSTDLIYVEGVRVIYREESIGFSSNKNSIAII